MMTDQSANKVWEAKYKPFGEAMINPDPDQGGSIVEINIRLPGQYYDKETGTYNNYYRDYDPRLGRYIQSDPRGISLDFSDPQRKIAEQLGLRVEVHRSTGPINHTYGYVDQNPLLNLDPTGENPIIITYQAWSFARSNNFGDSMSGENGNVWGEFSPQDGQCTMGPFSGLGDSCFPERCKDHDQCYDNNQCNASSWFSSAMGGSKSCNQCNSDFFD